jgi:multiple sugar transport system ATP-binding protein
MNFLEGTVGGGKLDLGVVKLDVPAGNSVAGMDGKNVIVGIRPEDIYDASVSPPSAPTEGNSFSAVVDVLEKLGAEDTAYLDLAGRQVIATLDPASRIEMGKSATFVVDTSKLHIFDANTEQAIR